MSNDLQDASPNMPVDGQHHSDPPLDGDKVLPPDLLYVTDEMLRTGYVPNDVVQEQHIALVKELQPTRTVRVAQSFTQEIRSNLPENQMEAEMEEKYNMPEAPKRNTGGENKDEDDWTKVIGRRKKKRFKNGKSAEAEYPDLFKLPDEFFAQDRVSGDADVSPPTANYEGGLMIIDGEHRMSKKKLIKYLTDLKIKPIESMSYDEQIKSLAKGGLMVMVPPHKALLWEKQFMSMQVGFKIRYHPPASANRRQANSVIIFGVDLNASLEEVRDGLRPVPCYVERFKRGNEPMNIVRVEYATPELAQHVIDIGWVKFHDQVWLSAEAPRSRKKTKFCRTCKRCKLDCTKRNCSALRCGRCGHKHKTVECKKPDEELKCLECKAANHLVFKCPVITKRINEEEARKKASKKAKRIRQRQRRKERDQAAKEVLAGKQKSQQQQESKVDPDKSFAQAVQETHSVGIQGESSTDMNEEVKHEAHTVNQFGFSADDMLRFACESYVAMLFPHLNASMAEKTAKDMVRRMKVAMDNGSASTMQMSAPKEPSTDMQVDQATSVAIDSAQKPVIELEVVNSEPKPVPVVVDGLEEVKQPTSKKQYKQMKLGANTSQQLTTMEVDRTSDISSWTEQQILSSGFHKLSVYEEHGVRIHNEWTVICGCGKLYEPRGRGEHGKKCPKYKYALVAAAPKEITQKKLSLL